MARKTDMQAEALLYAIGKYPTIGRTKLMKFVFFVDLYWCNVKHETLLEDEYTRMPRGPVPAYAFALSESSNEFFEVERKSIDPEITYYSFSPKRKASLARFDEDMLKLMDEILELLRKFTVRSISDFCHRFRLWRLSYDGDSIPQELFKLDKNEILEIESLVALSKARELSRAFSDSYCDLVDDQEERVCDRMAEMQLEVLDADDC